jgi:UPF0755 protein
MNADKKKPPLSGGSVVPPPRRRNWRRRLLVLAAAALAAIGAAGLLAAHNYRVYINAAEPGLTGDKLVAIDAGMSFKQVTNRLNQERVISSRPFFQVLARAKGVTTRVQAGEYTFKKGETPLQVLDIITRGDVTVWKLAVPEGATMTDIARRLQDLGPWSGQKFLAVTTDPQKTEALAIPIASMEGYLFPATYNLRISMTEEQVVNLMLERGLRERNPDRLRLAQDQGLTWHQVLTLASLIEKETAVATEKPVIAAVFNNRLKINMKLQCDPTAVYDLADFTPPVKKEHLKRESPYNTYVHPGLPPGPIANPGAGAIDAALNPSSDGYLYFVATGDGHHVFSVSYPEHRLNVKKYLKDKPGRPAREEAETASGATADPDKE